MRRLPALLLPSSALPHGLREAGATPWAQTARLSRRAAPEKAAVALGRTVVSPLCEARVDATQHDSAAAQVVEAAALDAAAALQVHAAAACFKVAPTLRVDSCPCRLLACLKARGWPTPPHAAPRQPRSLGRLSEGGWRAGSKRPWPL